MKKTLRILSIILVFALMLGCVMALASCTNAKDDEKKETKPYSDPEKAAEALENAGYTVRLLTDEDYLNEQGIEATIYAVNGDGEMISIAYYFDSDEAKEGYEEAKEEREDLGDKYEVGKSGKMVWMGTKAAIKAASGKGSSANDDENDDVGGSGIGGIGGIGGGSSATSARPNTDPEKAKQALEDAGYTVTLLNDADSINKEGVAAAITAFNRSGDMITIVYCLKSDVASDQYEEAKNELEDLEEAGLEADFEVGKYGKMVWLGTKDAIKAAK